MTASIVGWSHLPFGKYDNLSVEEMIVDVASSAIADAGLEPKDIDQVFLGHYNGGFVNQDFTSSLVFEAHPDFRFKPATRVENACATGSAAIHQGINAIDAKKAKRVLVVGVEKMSERTGKEVGEILIRAAYLKEEGDIKGGFAGVFGKITELYFQRYGDQSDALAHIAAKNHKNGCSNPYAQMRKDLGYDFCRNESEKNPFVAGPLKRTDCSLVSDGAAAIVLADRDTAIASEKAITFRSAIQVNDFLPLSRRDIVDFEGPAVAWQKAFAESGMTLGDLDLAETHDCFTVAELLQYEAMGLTKKGEGARALQEGWVYKDGKIPINVSGGLKAKGHPIGATGVSMHVLASMQLTGTAGDMQVPDAKTAGVFNMGGAAVANFVSILEPLK